MTLTSEFGCSSITKNLNVAGKVAGKGGFQSSFWGTNIFMMCFFCFICLNKSKQMLALMIFLFNINS